MRPIIIALATIVLATPAALAQEPVVANTGAPSDRVSDRADVMQEWDCKTGRYRITRRTFRTAHGAYVRSDLRPGVWIDVDEEDVTGAEFLKQACGKGSAKPAARPPAERPPGPHVITLPQH